MNIRSTILNLMGLKNKVDWKLLLFLILFLDVKLGVKILAIILIYLLRFDFHFGFKLKNSRLPLFYLLIALIAIAGAIINKTYALPNYALVLSGGIGFWLLCILAVHQVKLAVERNEPAVIHDTILLFFLINGVISLLNLGLIVLETHAFNPYTYQGQYQKYFMNTGDYIKGVTFDTSTTNAILNAFGVIYFLIRNNFLMVLFCMVILLLTVSNFTNLALIFILLLLFVFKSSKNQKSLITVCLIVFVIFMAKISPQNNSYLKGGRYLFHHQLINASPIVIPSPVLRITERPDRSLGPEEKREKTAMLYIDSIYRIHEQTGLKNKPSYLTNAVLISDAGRIKVPKDDINSASFQSLKNTPPEQHPLLNFIQIHHAALPVSGHSVHLYLPGKALGLLQTINFFKHHPGKLIAGDGLGNFSSKLAFRVTGLGINGGYLSKYSYINPDFLVNHLDLYLYFFSKNAEFHSFTNSPFSVYDQLIAEYGLLGIAAFFICYIRFFAQHWKVITYGLPLLVLTMGMLFIDYWFEKLSILIFFELFLFLDIKESSAAQI